MSLIKPHVGIYCPGVGTGGPWRYVHSILAGIDPGEFDVTVFCDLPSGYEPQPWVKVARRCKVEAVPASPAEAIYSSSDLRKSSLLVRLAPKIAKVWAGFGRQTHKLLQLFRQHPVDLFHTQNTGCEESPVAAKLAGISNILGTFHVDSTYDLHRERSGAGHRILEMLSNRCLESAIAVSNATKRDWLKRTYISSERIVTIHNGIDPDKFRRHQSRQTARARLGLPNYELIIGGLGRLDEAKGFTYLLDAVALLRRDFPNLSVIIAGEGELRKPLEAKAARLGIAEFVRFLGFQSDVQLVLDSLDVFALPSLCEALPFALLEAMATEIPTIGSAVGGVPEVIVPGITGFLVPPKNPEQLAASLRILLLDNDLRVRMGVAGRERVIRNFHEWDMVQKTINLYRLILRM